MNPSNIIATATELQATCTKVEIIAQARALGWKGDHARASVLQLALYVATKLGEAEQQEGGSMKHGQGPDGRQGPDVDQHSKGADGAQGADGAPPSGAQPSQEGAQDAQEGAQDAQEGARQGADSQKPQEGAQDAQEASQRGQHDAPDQSEEEAGYSDGKPQQPEGEQQQQQPEGEQQQQPEGEQQQQQPEGEQPEQQQPDEAAWNALLKAAGIDTPHPLLRKLHTIACAGLNPMLVGPAGTGKTMVASQLAQLLRVPFGSISCTTGMSESQLTGWLLPVGEHGRFDYVPSPFVQCVEQPSVFLLDEVDAADPNVLLLLNSVMSNGFITIPHKLKNPTIQRHVKSIIVAGANTIGGADEIYSARMPLDGATEDRFYPIVADYDSAYEKSLFVVAGQKKRTRSSQWKPSNERVDEQMMEQLQTWFFALRKGAARAKIGRIVSTRFAQRLTAAVRAGVPVEEAKADLLAGWTSDERARTGAGV